MLWVKAFHIIGVISWMAGLLYLPRLFVYHANVPKESERAAMLGVMERRLYRFIMTPALIITVIFGIILAWDLGVHIVSEPWFIGKITLVAGLAVSHFLMGDWLGDFAIGKNHHTPRFFRLVNEIPTLLMIVIVILVVVKPF
ncbi:MAG: protoporphyrinogen oxidase HemJ [Alphaproteobacteria bacterium]|nr:protoporphyrinogen oxidase HemJ [Alphaproteobacteria bacterium]